MAHTSIVKRNFQGIIDCHRFSNPLVEISLAIFKGNFEFTYWLAELFTMNILWHLNNLPTKSRK